MTITFGAVGTYAHSSTDPLTISAPTGQDSNSRTFLCVAMKTLFGSGYANPGEIQGWTKIGNVAGGVYPWTPSSGADVGIVQMALYYKDGVTGSATVTLQSPGTLGSIEGVMVRYQKSTGLWAVKMSYGLDETSAANYALTSTVNNFSGKAGDLVVAFTGTSTDAGSVSAEAITATGLTVGSVTNRLNQTTTDGDDMRLLVSEAPVTAGTTQTAPASYSHTNASTAQGTTMFLRLREIVAPTLTVNPSADFHVNPYYQIVVDGITDYDQFKLVRRDSLGEYADEPVRGGDLQDTPGSATILYDYEFHFSSLINGARNLSYILTMYSGGVADNTYTATVQPPTTERLAAAATAGLTNFQPPVTYISAVTTTANNTAVILENLDEFSSDGTILGQERVLGRRNPVVVSDVLSGMEGKFKIIAARFGTDDNTDANISAGIGTVWSVKQLNDLFRSGDVYYMKNVWVGEVGITDFYFRVKSVSVKRENRIAYQLGTDQSYDAVMTAEVQFVEVDRPATLTAAPTFTWQDVLDSNNSWTDVKFGLAVVNASWLDVLRDGA